MCMESIHLIEIIDESHDNDPLMNRYFNKTSSVSQWMEWNCYFVCDFIDSKSENSFKNRKSSTQLLQCHVVC